MAAAVELVIVLYEAVLPGSHFIPESCEQGVMRYDRLQTSVNVKRGSILVLQVIVWSQILKYIKSILGDVLDVNCQICKSSYENIFNTLS